ncbi:MAG TPA: hypothetical protein VKD69_03815, partial [Vicinamibacterales bacterium]|nr:hypothetical protein [Vicinamibacterales bacterium]
MSPTIESAGPDWEEVSETAIEYFSTAFPNPERAGCPGPERLRAAASSADPVSGDLRTHLFQCSECFISFRAARLVASSMNRNDSASPRRAWRRLAIGAAAVVAAIGVATALRVATGRAPGEDRLRTDGGTRASDRDSAAPATAEAGAARAGDAVRSVRLSF